MFKKLISSVCLISLLTGTLMSPAEADLAREVRIYIYRANVFADRAMGVGMPASPSVLGSYLWYLKMDESTRGIAGMDGLSRFVRDRQVPGLDFTGHQTLSDSDLETLFRPDQWIGGVRNASYTFRLLKLTGTGTTDRSLGTIARLFDLQVLMLSEHISDKGVALLKSLKQLRVLNVPSSLVTDASLPTLAQFKGLERLSLNGSQITDVGLRTLASLPLRQLDLGPHITDKGLEILKDFPRLEQLDLHASQVSGKGLAQLAHSARIHTLFLGPSIRNEDLAVLAEFKNLQRLDLTGAHLTDAAANQLGALQNVEELALTETQIGPKTLHALSQLPRLRYLEISRTPTGPEMFKSVGGFPVLQVLSFSSDKRLRPEDVRPLGRLPLLHNIVINGHSMGKTLVRYLQKQVALRGWNLNWLIPTAEAADGQEGELEQALEVASLPNSDRERPHGIGGLPLVHQSESSLDEIIPAPKMIGIDNQQDSEKNFIGEITIEAGGKVKIKK